MVARYLQACPAENHSLPLSRTSSSPSGPGYTAATIYACLSGRSCESFLGIMHSYPVASSSYSLIWSKYSCCFSLLVSFGPVCEVVLVCLLLSLWLLPLDSDA